MAAQVVGAALDQGDDGLARQLVLERLDQPWGIPLHDLGLQGERGRGDDDGVLLRHRVLEGGDQVGQGLAGAGAGLHEQVTARLEGARHLQHHLPLARAVLATGGLHRGVQEAQRLALVLRARLRAARPDFLRPAAHNASASTTNSAKSGAMSSRTSTDRRVPPSS